MKKQIFIFAMLAITATLYGQYENRITLESRITQKYVSVEGGSSDNNAAVVIWEDECQTDNLWELVNVAGTNNAQIKNVKSGKFLAVAGTSTSDGANIVLYEDRGQPDIVWKFEIAREQQGGQSYTTAKIRNVNSGRYLAIEGGDSFNGAKLVLWADKGQENIIWKVSYGKLFDYYAFVNCNSRLWAGVSNGSTDNYVNLVQWSSYEDDACYILEKADYFYKIKNRKSGKYLGVRSAGRQAGADIVITPDIGQADIQWEIIRVSPNGYKIKNRHSQLFLGVEGASMERGAKLVQWHDEGQKDIIWKFEPIIQ